MEVRNRRRRTIWLPVAFMVALAAAAQALHAGSASAATPPTLAAPADASSSPAVVLAGFTSQQYPVFFKLTGDGRKLTLAAIALNMTCTSGNQFVLEDGFAHLKIAATGKVHAMVAQAPTSAPSGDTESWTDSLAAKLGPRHTQLSGVWRLIVHYTFTDGSSDQCDSGPVRFLATA